MLLYSVLLRYGWKMILTNFQCFRVNGEETIMSQIRDLFWGEGEVLVGDL